MSNPMFVDVAGRLAKPGDIILYVYDKHGMKPGKIVGFDGWEMCVVGLSVGYNYALGDKPEKQRRSKISYCSTDVRSDTSNRFVVISRTIATTMFDKKVVEALDEIEVDDEN